MASIRWAVTAAREHRSAGGAHQQCVHCIRQALAASPSCSSVCRLVSPTSQAVVASGVSALTYSASSTPHAAAQAIRTPVTSAAASLCCSVDASAGTFTSSSRLRTWRA